MIDKRRKTRIYCDNKLAIKIANEVFNYKPITITYVKGGNNKADKFSKIPSLPDARNIKKMKELGEIKVYKRLLNARKKGKKYRIGFN